jgi:hypothetical protein
VITVSALFGLSPSAHFILTFVRPPELSSGVSERRASYDTNQQLGTRGIAS